MTPILFIILHFIVIYFSYIFIRKSPWIVLGVFVIAPLVSLPLWLGGVTDWFIIAKTYTIVFYLLWIQTARSIEKFNTNKVMLGGIYILLIINILEAMYRDIQIGNYFNAMAGLLLCITIPLVKDISIDNNGKYNDLIWNMTNLWVIAYTVWNITFVYTSYPYGAGVHVAVLGVPLIVGLINPKIWLQARVITLATHMMIRIFLNNYIESMYFDITRETSYYIASVNVMATASFLLAACCVVLMFYNKTKKVKVQFSDN